MTSLNQLIIEGEVSDLITKTTARNQKITEFTLKNYRNYRNNEGKENEEENSFAIVCYGETFAKVFDLNEVKNCRIIGRLHERKTAKGSSVEIVAEHIDIIETPKAVNDGEKKAVGF